MHLLRFATVATSVAVAASTANADLVAIPGLFNTGQGIGAGYQDPHWRVVNYNVPAWTRLHPSNTYMPATAASNWIWQWQEFGPLNVTLTFRLTFDLTGLDPTTAAITGRWACDNVGNDILINGVSTHQSMTGFTAWANFSVGSGFVAGVNTIDFVVTDLGNQAAFRAELAGTVQTLPAPAASALIGAAGVVGRRRRR